MEMKDELPEDDPISQGGTHFMIFVGPRMSTQELGELSRGEHPSQISGGSNPPPQTSPPPTPEAEENG